MRTGNKNLFLVITGAAGAVAFIVLCILLHAYRTGSAWFCVAGLFSYCYDALAGIDHLSFLLFFMLNIVAERNVIFLPYGGSVSAGFAIILAAMFLFEPPVAVLMASFGVLITGGIMHGSNWGIALFHSLQYLFIYSISGIAMLLYFEHMPEFFDDELYRHLMIGGVVTFIYLSITIPFTNAYIAILNPEYASKRKGLNRIFEFSRYRLKIFQTIFLFPLAVIIAYSYDIVGNPFVPLILAFMCIGSVRFVDQHQRIGQQTKKTMALYRLFQKMSATIFGDPESQISHVDLFKNLLSDGDISIGSLVPNHRTIIYAVEPSGNSYVFSPVTSFPAAGQEETEVPGDDVLLWKIARNRKSVRLNDLSAYNEIHHKWSSVYSSLIAFPVVIDSETAYITVMFRKSGLPFREQDTRFVHLLANSLGFTLKNMQLRDRLREQAIRDGLLGIFNRRYLIDKLDEEISRARRYGRPLSVMILDVDHFKEFNDTHGHVSGDQVLKDVTGIIRESIRSTDIPARYGGDEFFITLPETSVEGAFTVASKIHQSVSGHKFKVNQDQEVSVSVSIGVTEMKHDAEGERPETVGELTVRADDALYEAKRKGRNRVCMNKPK